MFFKVKRNDQAECSVGANNNKHLEISVRVTDQESTPVIEGRAYLFEGKEFTEYHSWDIGQLSKGDRVTIEVVDECSPTEPTTIEFSSSYRQKYTSGTREYIRDQSGKVKERTKRLKETTMVKNRVIECSFCGKVEGEVRAILPHNSVAICNECIAMCNEILNDKNA